MRKLGLSIGFREPNIIPLLPFFGNQNIQRNAKWVPYQLKPRPKWGWKGSSFQGDRRMEAGCDQALSRQSSRDTAPEFLLLWPWQLPPSPLPLKPCWLNILLDSRGSQYPSTKFIVFLKRLQSLFPCLSTENIIHPESANWVAQCPSVSQQVETTCLLILKDLNQTLYFYFFFFFKEPYRHTLYLIIYGLCLNFWFIPGVTDHLDTSVWRVFFLTEDISQWTSMDTVFSSLNRIFFSPRKLSIRLFQYFMAFSSRTSNSPIPFNCLEPMFLYRFDIASAQ